MVRWEKVTIMAKEEKVKYSKHINEQRQDECEKMSHCILGIRKRASNEQLVTVG